MRIAAVVIDSRAREVGVDDDPEAIVKLVGGDVERLPVSDYIVAYLNVDDADLPPSPLADRLLSQLGVAVFDGVRGTLVLVGLFAGRHTDAPGIVRDLARRLR